MSRSESSTTLSTMDSAYSIMWNRLFRGSEHEFSAAAFHRLCDNQGPTVVLIKAKNGRVAAGYSCVSWKSGGGVRENNPNGFLCAIDSDRLSLELFKGVSGVSKIYQFANHGPDFYDGVCIMDKCDKNLSSSSKIGSGFVDVFGDKVYQSALFGSEHFTVAEYEVFGIEYVF
jgi:hypothetical protein